MTTRALAAIALLLAVGACSGQASDNSANTANASGATNAAAVPAPGNAVAEPAPPLEPPAPDATDPEPEEGDVMAGRERGPAPSAKEEAREGCAGEIGPAKARELVRQCIDVSPATRPPCNTANSCELIQSEIDRSCALFRDDPPASCPER